MSQKQVCAFREICSDHDFKGKLETTIQIFCATKLEISVYLWNEIIQEVIELLIHKAFLIWPSVGLGLYLLFRTGGRPEGKEANGPKLIGKSTIFQWLGVNFFKVKQKLPVAFLIGPWPLVFTRLYIFGHPKLLLP